MALHTSLSGHPIPNQKYEMMVMCVVSFSRSLLHTKVYHKKKNKYTIFSTPNDNILIHLKYTLEY